jgi:paraquat-inducible protein B
MARKANPTVIGAFALGAIALSVGALVVFGSGKFFTVHPRAVAFFQGNIQGLNVGAPVNLRGVEIGTVTDIRILVDPKTMIPHIPVYLEFDPERMSVRGSTEPLVDFKGEKPLKIAIANGLHARLATQSMVTGQLLVELDLDPDEPRTLTGGDPKTIEIPTSESDIQKLKNVLSNLPIDEIGAKAVQVLDDIHRTVSSAEVPKLLQSLVSVSDGLGELVTSLRNAVAPLVDDARATTRSARESLAAAQTTLEEMRVAIATANQLLKTDVRDTAKAATDALHRADKTLIDADKAIVDINSLVAANSAQRYDIDQTLRNLTATTRSLRSFADQLDRRPSAIVTGK